MYSCFASTSKGLEELLTNELISLGATDVNAVHAGVTFSANMEVVLKINLHSRIASRVLIQVGVGSYTNENDIYDLAYDIDWYNWFGTKHTIKVDTNAIGCPLKSLEFVTLKVKDAICDCFVSKVNLRPSVSKQHPDIRIYNFLTKDSITIYIDTSGESLFKRGYRQSKLEAPLKENLASGIIQLTHWNRDTPLYDPMCGSGTLIIEAISYAMNLAPGLRRSFAFENFTGFERNLWNKLKVEAKTQINYAQKFKIYAGDIDPQALNLTKENLRNLELLQYVKFISGDFLKQNAPETSGMLITNPPYGVRLGEEDDLAKFYPQLASHLKNNYANWDCYFLTADLRMPKLMRLKPSRKIPLFNGALECRLFEFKMVSGSNR